MQTTPLYAATEVIVNFIQRRLLSEDSHNLQVLLLAGSNKTSGSSGVKGARGVLSASREETKWG